MTMTRTQSPDQEIKEIWMKIICVEEHATDPGLKGVLIVGRPGASFLDDLKYTSVLNKLNDLAVPLYIQIAHLNAGKLFTLSCP
jgi:hypothetical protein